MRLLVGVATAAVFHGLLFGVGLMLLPRAASPAPAPAEVDVDVDLLARPEPLDRPPAVAPPSTPAPSRARPPARRPHVQPQVLAASPAPASEAVPAGAGALAPSRGPAIAAARDAPTAAAVNVSPAEPQYRSNPAPEYPIASHRRHEEGTVLLKVAVGADGLPTAVSLERSCGHHLLDDAALETVRRWTFAPARAAGVAIASVVVIPVRFTAAQADR